MDRDRLDDEAWKIFKSTAIPGSDEMDMRDLWDRSLQIRRTYRAAALRSHAQKEGENVSERSR